MAKRKTKRRVALGSPQRSRISGKLDLAEDMAERFELAGSCEAKFNVYEQIAAALGAAQALNERRGGRLSSVDLKRLRTLNSRADKIATRLKKTCLCGKD